MTLLNERKPSNTQSEAVSEAQNSLPPFTARDGVLKNGGSSRTTL